MIFKDFQKKRVKIADADILDNFKARVDMVGNLDTLAKKQE
jgi:hypothetical protein